MLLLTSSSGAFVLALLVLVFIDHPSQSHASPANKAAAASAQSLNINGQPIRIDRVYFSQQPLRIFCWPGVAPVVADNYWPTMSALPFAFHSAVFRVSTGRISASLPAPRLFLGANASDVVDRVEAAEASLLRWLLLPAVFGDTGSHCFEPLATAQRAYLGPMALPLPLLQPACVGVLIDKKLESEDDANLNAAYFVRVDFGLSLLRLATFAFGCCLLAWAPNLSRRATFRYTGGALAGVLLSAALLVLLLNRLLPLRRLLWPLLVASAAGAGAIWTFITAHAAQLAERHRTALAAYVGGSVCLSLAVCYWMGPLTNPRTFRLLEMVLRAVALLCMTAACQFWQVSVLTAAAVLLRPWIITVVVVATSVGPLAASSPSGLRRSLWQRLEPAFWRWCPRRLRPLHRRRRLTRAEFARQGRRCTEDALAELRRHCASPDCDAWRVSARLRNPAEFAQFVQGGSHLQSLLDSADLSSDSDQDSEARAVAKGTPSKAQVQRRSLATPSGDLRTPVANGNGRVNSAVFRSVGSRTSSTVLLPREAPSIDDSDSSLSASDASLTD